MTPRQELDLLHKVIHVISSPQGLPELLRKICNLVVNSLGSDSCLIYLHDSGDNSLMLSGSHNPHPGALGKVRMKVGEGITGWVAAHKKPVSIEKKAYQDPRFKFFSSLPEDKYESFISVPILTQGELTGVINLHWKKAHAKLPPETELLTTVAKLAAGSIENAKLDFQAKERAKQIDTLAQVSKLVAGESFIEEILRLIVSITADSLGFKIISLMLLDSDKKFLSIAATQSLSLSYRKKSPVPIGKSLSGRAVLEGKPIAIYDVREEPDYHYPEIAREEGLSSLLSTPMTVGEDCLGVLNCYTQKPHRFTETEVRMAASVAHQTAIAIVNTRLKESAKASQEELESRKIVERAKGILMKELKLSEEEAFKEIRKSAMDRRKSMKEIAEAIILSRELQKTSS